MVLGKFNREGKRPATSSRLFSQADLQTRMAAGQGESSFKSALQLDGDVEAPLVHPEIVMVFPRFSERTHGREPFPAGFRDFYQNAKIHELRDCDYQADVVGDTAVVTFRYEIVYERVGEHYRATGLDL